MTAPLIIVPPIALTDAMLVSTDVAETEHAAWAAVTSYAVDVRVIHLHKVWQSLQASNTNHEPGQADEWWQEVGPTNQWALFDGSYSTQTAQSTSMTYVLEAGQAVPALVCQNVQGCNAIDVTVDHPSYLGLFDKTYDMASLPAEAGWWEWTFGERTAPTVLVELGLPAIPGCTITVTFSGTVDLAVGVLQIGQTKEIGEGVLQGARLGIQDFSRKETNDFGETVLVQRAFSKRANFDIPIRRAQIDSTYELLASLRATPVLWIGSRDIGASVIYGFFQEFEVVLAYTSIAECSISIEGLT